MKISPTPPRKLTDVTITLTPAEFAVLYALLGQAYSGGHTSDMYAEFNNYYESATGIRNAPREALREYAKLTISDGSAFSAA